MKRNIINILILSLIGPLSWSQTSTEADQIFQLNTITSAVPFLIISPDSRSGGMGDAGVATSPDANSFHWNTSKLAFSNQDAELTVAYSPWLRTLVDDIKLSYLAGYKKLNKKNVIGGSLRYFSLGEIIFTDFTGNETATFNPNEFELLGGYALLLSDNMSIGINGKFIYSNITGGISNGSNTSKAGLAGATDISFSYRNPKIQINNFDSELAFGASISNIGNKMTYSSAATRDFLPTNLRLGTALKVNFDSYNSLSVAVDFNKLMIPTLPFIDPNDASNIISGKNNEVGVIAGMLQSFSDAPGIVFKDEDGEYQVQKGSKLKEELREINIGGGIEYWYSDILSFRTGFFHESASKGNRKYMTFGAGLKAYSFGLDISYLVSVTQNNPLANTIRFSLSFRFGDNNSTGGATKID